MAAIVERYTRKSAEVEAVQFIGTVANVKDLLTWAAGKGQFTIHVNQISVVLVVGTTQGNKRANADDWIVRDDAGGFDVLTAAELAVNFSKEVRP